MATIRIRSTRGPHADRSGAVRNGPDRLSFFRGIDASPRIPYVSSSILEMSTEERVAGAGRTPLDELRSLQIERRPVRSQKSRGPRIPWGWLIAIGVIVAAVVFLREPVKRWYAEQTTPPLDTGIVVRTGGQQVLLTGSGYVNADAVVIVGTTIPGRVRNIAVDKGDRV